jgi:amidohydrolase
MKRFLLAAFGAAMALAGPAWADEALNSAIDQDYPYLRDLYLYLHQHPELSYHEVNSSSRMAEEMRALGFEVTEDVGGYGVVSVMRNGPGPVLLIRTDMDALPVKEQTGLAYASTVITTDDQGNEVPVMHACGHDIHMSSFVGTARRLAALKDSWSGTLIMIDQPAEERGGGAKAMLDAGLFEQFPKPDYNLAFHDAANAPAGAIGYTKGWALASVDSVDLTVFGIGGHGAYPEATKDPIVLSAEIILALQTLVSRETSALDSAVVTVGSIHGGTKHNIIPDRVDLQLTVRSYTDEVRDKLLSGIERIAVNMGRAAGLPEDKLPKVEVIAAEHTPATYNDEALTDRVVAAFRAEGVSDIIREVPPVMGGEDFSRYGRTDDKIPSLIFWVGAVKRDVYQQAEAAGEALPSLHSPFFAPDPEPTIKTAVRAMTVAALELLGKPNP